MSQKVKQLADLQFCFAMYSKSKHGSWLSDTIRAGGATDTPWPAGMAEAVADLIDKADPWTSRDQASSDDTWIMYIYWRESELKTGKQLTTFSKEGIRAVENWFAARGTPKAYETIRTRLRENYNYWHENLSEKEIQAMTEAARGGAFS
jgi:hypothetical protein